MGLVITLAAFTGLTVMACLLWIFIPDLEGENWRVALVVNNGITLLLILVLFLVAK